jgi:hypothetical protein
MKKSEALTKCESSPTQKCKVTSHVMREPTEFKLPPNALRNLWHISKCVAVKAQG